MATMPKEKLFEFFDAEKTELMVKNDVGGNAFECATECEGVLDDFAESDQDKVGIWYRGERNLVDVVASFRKIAVNEGYHISASVAETSDHKEAILLRRLSESEFLVTQKKEP